MVKKREKERENITEKIVYFTHTSQEERACQGTNINEEAKN